MKHLIALLLLSLLLLPFLSQAQGLAQKEQIATKLLTELRSSKDDLQTEKLHAEFKKAMAELVRSKDFFDFPLQSLKIADLKSNDQTLQYLQRFCFAQRRRKGTRFGPRINGHPRPLQQQT
jgi:hypothetical protein